MSGPSTAVARRHDGCALATYRQVVTLVSDRTGVPVDQIDARSGGMFNRPPRPVARARHSALYLCVVGFDHSMRAVARAAAFTPEGVRKALMAIEDLRDDPEFDDALAGMERELLAS